MAMARASAATLRQIPQLAAPILTAAEEKMMVDMVRKGRGTESSIQVFTRRLQAGRDAATKANDALKTAGNLKTSFTTAIDKAMGFDVAAAVKLLKVPPASSDGSSQTTTGGTTVGTTVPPRPTTGFTFPSRVG